MIVCPECGGLDLDVLRASSNSRTLRCLDCDAVFTASPATDRTTPLRLIVSEAGESQPQALEVVTTDIVSLGDEFEADGHRYLVTSIEGPVGPTTSCRVSEAKVVHAKLFDQVQLQISVNEGEVTRSYQLPVEPEEPVRIGQVLEVEGRLVAVKTLKSDQNRTIRKGFLFARNVRRAFCDPAPPKARPGDQVPTRSRRAPAPTRKRGPPKGPWRRR